MPPLPELAGTVQAVISWVGPGGATADNVVHLLTTGNPTAQDMVGLANGIFLAVDSGSSGIIGQISEDWTLSGVTCVQLYSPFAEGVSTHAPAAGTNTNHAYSPAASVVLSWSIAARYRGGKPRTYLPGVPQSDMANPGGSRLLTASAGAWQTAGNNFLAAVNALTPSGGGTWALGMLKRVSGKTPEGKPIYINPPVFYPYSSCSVNTRIGTQKRRNGKLTIGRV